jgi:DNA (cytosine-5)-methyltransferase 1
MRLLDLFAGIGGFSLAAHWMGWETVAFVEKDEFCQKVLRKNFGDVPIYGDIREFEGTTYRGAVDIVCGGFPCQPFSVAGKQKGRGDERFLWKEMLRVVQVCQPRWVVAENVRGLLSNERGLVFESVCSDLEMAGYSVQSFIVPACAVNAPHKRNRVWIVANSNCIRRENEQEKQIKALQDKIGKLSPTQQSGNVKQCGACKYDSVATYADGKQRTKTRLQVRESKTERQRADFERSDWVETATELCGINDGVSNRVDRLRALGNAIVPQIAFEIFKAIEHAKQQFRVKP